MSNEHLYRQAILELTQTGPIAGLWAKAYAECEGNEPKAKAMYLRMRVEQLEITEQEKISHEKHEILKKIAQRNLQSLQEAKYRIEKYNKEQKKLPLLERDISRALLLCVITLMFFIAVISAFT